MRYEIWHNPRCSKSRGTLALLREAGVELTVRDYLADPPSADEIRTAARRLGATPFDIARPADVDGEVPDPTDHDAWIERLAAEPRLIERPIVMRHDGRAVIGRPPERVAELLDEGA